MRKSVCIHLDHWLPIDSLIMGNQVADDNARARSTFSHIIGNKSKFSQLGSVAICYWVVHNRNGFSPLDLHALRSRKLICIVLRVWGIALEEFDIILCIVLSLFLDRWQILAVDSFGVTILVLWKYVLFTGWKKFTYLSTIKCSIVAILTRWELHSCQVFIMCASKLLQFWWKKKLPIYHGLL